MALTIALCDACPSSEVDEMTISLLNIFDSRGLGFTLLEALIEHEVDETGMFKLLVACKTLLTSCRKRSRAATQKLRCHENALRLCKMEGRYLPEGDLAKGSRAPCSHFKRS